MNRLIIIIIVIILLFDDNDNDVDDDDDDDETCTCLFQTITLNGLWSFNKPFTSAETDPMLLQ